MTEPSLLSPWLPCAEQGRDRHYRKVYSEETNHSECGQPKALVKVAVDSTCFECLPQV